MDLFRRVGTRWMLPPMGGTPYGLRWEAIYPLMERMQLSGPEWDELHDDLQTMEFAAVAVMHEFAPKPKKADI